MSTRVFSVVVALGAVGAFTCGSSSHQTTTIGPGTGGSHGGTGGQTGNGTGGASGGGGMSGTGGVSGSAGVDGGQTCSPGVVGSHIIDCGYPRQSNTPLTAITFSESEVLRAIEPSGGAPTATVKVFYNDEHALTLGVRQVVLKDGNGTTMMDYPVSPLTAVPGSVNNPQTGTNELAGDQNGLDPSLRPMWPVLFITDITADAQARAGDWQMGGRPTGPTAVFGSWKAAVRTVDKTVMPNRVTITPDKDPLRNNWDLAGGDAVPAGLANQGFGAEARWSVPLQAGHNYRLQVIVHDGDQNKAGGDSGEACVIFCAGGSGGGGTGGAGGSGPPPSCPAGVMACGAGGIDPVSCPAGTVCANGCCLQQIP